MTERYEEARDSLKEVDSREVMGFLRREMAQAYRELVGSSEKRSVLKQRLNTTERPPEEGPTDDVQQRALMVVETEDDNWAKLRARLREAPIIQSILKGAKRLRKTELGERAARAGEKIQEKVEDVREFWETSQNPLVYQASSIVDAMRAETDLAVAVRWLRKLDPNFSLEEWRLEVSKELAPEFVNAFAKGDILKLKPWLADGIYSRLSQEIKLRKQEGLRYDDAKVLDVEHCDILATALDDNDGPPTFVVQFMTQQINCVRSRDGVVVEGSPDDIRAYFYAMAFQRHYDPNANALIWKIIDFQLGGGDAYY